MKKRSVITILIVLALIILISNINAVDYSGFGEKEVNVHLFYGKGCGHCANLINFLEIQEEKTSNIKLHLYESYFDENNREMFERFASAYNTEIKGVPMTFIGEEAIVGANTDKVFNEIKKCSIEGCEDPLKKINGGNGFIEHLTIPAVLGAAAIDAINPCAFAVLIILLSTILINKNRRKALFSGLAFTLAIFISYFLMGIGLYSAISASGLTHWFYIIVAGLAIVIGLFNLKDYFWYGRWFKMEVPEKWRPRMKLFIKSVTSSVGAFFVGFIVSLFLLPCTSGPYIVILGLLSKIATKNYALLLLLLYNLIFIIPMILITFGIYFGITTTEKTEEWRQRSLKKLHLIAGIIILLLGIGMIIALLMGWL